MNTTEGSLNLLGIQETFVVGDLLRWERGREMARETSGILLTVHAVDGSKHRPKNVARSRKSEYERNCTSHLPQRLILCASQLTSPLRAVQYFSINFIFPLLLYKKYRV